MYCRSCLFRTLKDVGLGGNRLRAGITDHKLSPMRSRSKGWLFRGIAAAPLSLSTKIEP